MRDENATGDDRPTATWQIASTDNRQAAGGSTHRCVSLSVLYRTKQIPTEILIYVRAYLPIFKFLSSKYCSRFWRQIYTAVVSDLSENKEVVYDAKSALDDLWFHTHTRCSREHCCSSCRYTWARLSANVGRTPYKSINKALTNRVILFYKLYLP